MSEITTFKIHSIEATNFRAFKSLKVDFHDNLTVLVAKNGEGKTSVLDAVAIALTPFAEGFDDIKGRAFERDDVRLFQVRKTRSNEMEYAAGGATIKATATLYQLNKISWARQRLPTKKTNITEENTLKLKNTANVLQNKIRSKENSEKTILPLIASYGTSRLWLTKTIKQSTFDMTSRLVGYNSCFDSQQNFNSISKWLSYWKISEIQDLFSHIFDVKKNKAQSEFTDYMQSVNHPISICLKNTEWKSIRYDIGKQVIVCEKNDDSYLPIHSLSDGVRNMIALVADIAFRATKLNPHLGADASRKTPGIVLIDEVDMHLHPEWQQLVLGGLTEAFPEVQFIVTTHSPQVLTTVPAECIRELSREGDDIRVTIPEFSLGAESNYVLDSIQGVNARPKHLPIVQELEEYQSLISHDEWDTPRALELREKLNNWGHGFEPALIKMDMDVRMRAYRRGKSVK